MPKFLLKLIKALKDPSVHQYTVHTAVIPLFNPGLNTGRVQARLHFSENQKYQNIVRHFPLYI